MVTNKVNLEQVNSVLDNVYAWSRSEAYRGYNKHDGLNSPILRLALGWGKWPRILAIQSVMRSPINLRPYLAVKKTYNPKGLALFAQGLMDRFRVSGDPAYLREAEDILALLHSIKSKGNWSGGCWGYHYPWQDPGFFAPSGTPNAVVTCFVCEAYIDAYRLTGKSVYLEIVASAIKFFLRDLCRLADNADELCLSYMPMPMTMCVMDVSILIGAVISQYIELSGDTTEHETARRLVGYVVGKQTEYGAWFYTDPPSDSHIRHDNYHTGFILDALMRYINSSRNDAWRSVHEQGLHFYANKLFNHDGSPRWMSDQDFPHDIHGAAQGILTFSAPPATHSHPDTAANITQWAISNMYNPQGRFYYQETKYYRKKFTLLRWCNAWMARALSRHALSLQEKAGTCQQSNP